MYQVWASCDSTGMRGCYSEQYWYLGSIPTDAKSIFLVFKVWLPWLLQLYLFLSPKNVTQTLPF